MSAKCEIDFLNFSKDLDNYSNKIFYKERLDSSLENEIILQEKMQFNDYGTNKNTLNNISSEDAFNENKENMSAYGILVGDIIKSLNYCINYLKMKEINSNEKYFIYFSTNVKRFMNYLIELTDKENFENLSYESDGNKKVDLKKDKKIHFLLVGKIGNEENENNIYQKVLLNYFGSKSEMIPYDNMKKIKSILSGNNIINDNIIFPNEIYK